MVGLVVVAHSRALAQAAIDLALEMVSGEKPPVAIAAGVADGAFGTDAVAVKDAIQRADDGDGVVVLMDLGSAVLSSEMALELLSPDQRDRVHLTAAPLVEGLVAAVVEAAAGAPPATVVREATAGLHGKQTQLGTAADVAAEVELGEGERAGFTLGLPHGLHARPAARLVGEAKRFAAVVQIRNATTGSGYVPATSLSRVAALGARQGHDIEVIAAGPQAAAAVRAIVGLAARDFDEHLLTLPVPVESTAGHPLPGSPGIAIGPKWTPGGGDVVVPEPVAASRPESEWRDLQVALSSTRDELTQSQARLRRHVDEQHAAIFDAYLLLLEDAEIMDNVKAAIDGGAAAAPAWKRALGCVEQEWGQLDNPYLNARAADVRAVCNQVLRHLLGQSREILPQPGILVADDLSPNDIARLATGGVAGIVTAHGSPTSHAAILARALGIPAVVAAGPGILDIADGTEMIIDGADGIMFVDPSADTVARYGAKAEKQAAVAAAARSRAQQPAVTTDGALVEVAANLGSLSDLDAVAASGADSVGLLRTEFFFIDRAEPPSASEQEAHYRSIAEGVGGRRLTIRTLDAGGDKPLSYLPIPREDNPFLGLRGIRLSLRHPELLREQLTAIVRLAHDHPVSVMFPMVTTVAELDEALAMLDGVCREQQGRPQQLEVGIMVEVPAVAVNAAAFAPKVDFVSIGTNDLAQYALAAERGNEYVAHLSDALDPGVLRLMQSVVTAAGEDTRVAVCGELAADLTAVPILIGLGIDELSVNRFAVAAVKDEVRHWSQADAAALATQAMGLNSAAEVRTAVRDRRAT
jgi:phosphocarrier protein FPr